MIEISLRGEQVELHAERAMYWRRKATLLVADTHWGKAATLRSAGVPIPGGSTSADLARLSELVRRTGASRLVLLGDAIHARAGRAAKTLGAVAEWRAAHRELDVMLVRGNHDAHAGDPPAELEIRCANAPVVEQPFAFQHFPAPSALGYVLAGHTHPAVRVRGRGGESARVPCFLFTPSCGTLPAFGSLTGCAIVTPEAEDLVYGIADGEVLEIG